MSRTRSLILILLTLAFAAVATAPVASAAPRKASSAKAAKAAKAAAKRKLAQKAAVKRYCAKLSSRRRARVAKCRKRKVSKTPKTPAGTRAPDGLTTDRGAAPSAPAPVAPAPGAGTADRPQPVAPAPKPAPAPVATPAPVTGSPAPVQTPAPAPVATPDPATPSAPSAPARPLTIGMNANTQAWGNDTGLEQDRVKATGARSLREEFRWSVIEPADDRWDFSRYDRVVREAARRRMTVLPLLFHSPAWAAASTVTLPADEAKFADYVAHVVARYGAGGDFWDANPELADYAPTHFELWNEPYFKVFSATGADAGRYARLVRAAVTAGRAANPEAKYLIQADVTSTNDWVRYDEWIDAMYAAVPDLGKYFDAVAVHPYAGGDPNAWTPERPSSARWQTRRMDQILASFAAHGDRKPLQITEIGWSTCAAGCQTEAQQAEYMKKLFELVSTRYAGSVEAVYWYGWRDWGPADANKEHWFGMIARDGRQKPAYRAYQELTGVA